MPFEITMRELLEAGVHFGHQTRRWNPKMAPYIFTKRNGIHIIDLAKTIPLFKTAWEFVRDEVANGASILFVGTKKQAQEIIKEQAERCGAFYINERWPGGLLTNFYTVRKSIEKLKKLERMEAEGAFEILPKKEVVKLKKKKEKLEKILGGIKDMEKIPDILYVVDTVREELAVREAKKLGIPVVAIADTNCDPDVIDYPIPGNDDAIKAINLITTKIADAVLEGKSLRESVGAEMETESVEAELLKKAEEEGVAEVGVVESGIHGANAPEKEEALEKAIDKEVKEELPEEIEEAKEELK
ncbi:SSU ribosomal protein S2P [Persephonella hydrogeniphila]|uniref:Small ribosomal subunit protein uS2 n=1 Tax=Persephonella hydrogeniphila TaxID=198703 RepID=A0A285NJ68_9AQUI|nr:30S ribosomal protein S2 [Persephonella hydrogeniphila]SNZ09499.1 SSU ribosomal protein S2P [Persephonella hydrogeniphila]